MILPITISLEPICFGTGKNGASIRVYRNSTLGITKVDKKEPGDKDYRSTWTLDGDPREFGNYFKLRAANRP